MRVKKKIPNYLGIPLFLSILHAEYNVFSVLTPALFGP